MLARVHVYMRTLSKNISRYQNIKFNKASLMNFNSRKPSKYSKKKVVC